MMSEIYRTSALPGASLGVFHQAGATDVLLTLSTEGVATAQINLYVGPADLERLAADLLAAAQAIQLPRRELGSRNIDLAVAMAIEDPRRAA
jgi:hypothetical protein